MKQKESVFNLKEYKKARKKGWGSSTSSITERLLEKYKPSRSDYDIAKELKKRDTREVA
tara:strand:- start:131 stop:307 length:177 start_codon:yes stop_codon:yes gene_type:complete